MIVDKPAGLLTIPTPKNESRTLTSILNDEEEKKGSSYRLHPCHRLDRETSGVIVYAKGKAVQKKMMDVFHQHGVEKRYYALAHGSVEPREGRITRGIEGRPAVTRYRVVKTHRGFSIVDVTPVTGRTNQIRIHFKSIGYPLVGETRFVFRRDYELRAKRLCLHASAIDFVHPVTGKQLHCEAPLPQDLVKFLETHQ